MKITCPSCEAGLIVDLIGDTEIYRKSNMHARIADLEAQNAKLLAFVNDVMTLDAPANYARAGLETLADKARALLAELDKGETE